MNNKRPRTAPCTACESRKNPPVTSQPEPLPYIQFEAVKQVKSHADMANFALGQVEHLRHHLAGVKSRAGHEQAQHAHSEDLYSRLQKATNELRVLLVECKLVLEENK